MVTSELEKTSAHENMHDQSHKNCYGIVAAIFMKKLRRMVLICGAICICAVFFYICSFACYFDVFGDAVRDNKHGWLGPEIRGNSHTVDIGKVGYYEGIDFSLYQKYSPLCRLWLFGMGFSN